MLKQTDCSVKIGGCFEVKTLIKYKHISFDLWLTLIKSNPDYKSKRNELFKSFFNIKENITLISEKVKYFDDLCNSINEVVGKNIDTFEIYLLILKSLNVDISNVNYNVLTEFYYESELLFLKHKPILINSSCAKILEHLKENSISTNILSNTGFIKGRTLREFIKNIDFDCFFDFQIYSDECNYSKPNHLIFEHTYKCILDINKNVLKKEVLHIGDNVYADYQGAIDFGFNSFLIKN